MNDERAAAEPVPDDRVPTARTARWPLAWLSVVLMQAATANPVSTEHVTARLLAEQTAFVPGQEIELALVLDIRPGWHTYWANPGDSGEPTRLDWRLPAGFEAGAIRWPYPQLIRVGPLANYGYSDQAVHLTSVATPADWPQGKPAEIAVSASWLVCEEHCIPESAELRLSLPSTVGPAVENPGAREVFAGARERLPRPLSGESELRRTGDMRLRLSVEAPAIPESAETVRFFAGAWGLIEHAAEQPWNLEGGHLRVDLVPGAAADQTPTAGVLVVQGEGRSQSFFLAPQRVSAQDSAAAPPTAPDLGLPLALGFALLGGLILNLMPCVFPVLAMKAVGLTRQTGVTAAGRVLQGLAYAAGVLVFFALVAALLLALRAAGAAVGWGYQLQYPPFVALMAYLFLVLGMSLSGAVTLGSRLMGIGGAAGGSGTGGAFTTGALAALVAAPCTAPFMGAALGYAMTLSWHLALAVMLALGLGLALPYLLLSLIPEFGKKLPKSNLWMEHLKQFLAFPMYATAAWLVWVLSVQAGPPGVAAVLSGMVLLAVALWSWERGRQATGRVRLFVGSIAAVIVAASLLLGLRITPGMQAPGVVSPVRDDGRPALTADDFSPERLASARAQGQPAFVNMTAAWCITCLVNERVALSSAAVAAAFASGDVLYLKGDWTNRDPEITEYLRGFGRSGVPLYVFYPAAGEPRVLPQILTQSIVLEALAAATSERTETLGQASL